MSEVFPEESVELREANSTFPVAIVLFINHSLVDGFLGQTSR